MRPVAQLVRHRSNVALLVILAVGFGIRAFELSQFAVTQWDEGAIWRGALWFVTRAHNVHYNPMFSPPLPPVLFGIFAWPFGLSPRVAVWLSVSMGAGSIGLMYLLVSRLGSRRAALIASGLLAVSGLHIMYSRSLLTESCYVFFLLAALLSSVEYLRTRSLKWLLLTAASASCLQLTKYNGCLVALPLLIVLAGLQSVEIREKRLIVAVLLPTSFEFQLFPRRKRPQKSSVCPNRVKKRGQTVATRC